MSKVKMPSGELNMRRKFSAEGFCRLNVLDAIVEVGYSRSEARRLFDNGALKVRDTRIVPDDGFVWYRRRADRIELVEPDEPIYIGKFRVLTICEQRRSVFVRLLWRLRLWLEKRLESGRWFWAKD